jgi:predicted membrane channel-forming protein YqfA (hemolysin III family)
MLKSLFVVLTVGVVGFAVSGIVFGLLFPLVIVALKILFFVLIGYLILRLVKPEMADNLKNCCTGKNSEG